MHLLNTAERICVLMPFDAEHAASLRGGYHIPIKLRINPALLLAIQVDE